jgi:protein O-mannosyl-transferase
MSKKRSYRRSRPQRRNSSSRYNRLIEWSRSHPLVPFASASAIWVGMLYAGCLRGPFIYDDIDKIQGNLALTSWTKTSTYFFTSQPFAQDLLPGGGSAYRPLCWLSFCLDRHLWGLNSYGFHITNLLLHWGAGVLFFILLRQMLTSAVRSAAVCFLWLALPIQSEAVAWISGRAYPLMCVFLALSLLMSYLYLVKGSASALFVYLASFIAALLSNEQSILLLPLTLLLLICLPRSVPRYRGIILGAIGAILDGIYLLLRERIHAQAPRGHISFFVLGTTVFKYAAWTLLPVHMSIERSTDLPADSFSIASAIALTGLIAVIALAWGTRRKMPYVTFGLLWFLIALLPFCGIIPIYQGMAERYAYLASFGILLAIVAAAWQTSGKRRSTFIALLLLWGAWNVWRLRERAQEWDNPIALYQSSLIATPRSSKLLYNLGTTYEMATNFSLAREYYEKTLAIDPRYAPAIIELGNLDQQEGNLAQAKQEYQQALALSPSDETIYCDLGVVLFRQGNLKEAESILSRAIVLSPSDSTAYYDLGAIYQHVGDNQKAMQMYNKVLELKPGDPDTVDNMRSLR